MSTGKHTKEDGSFYTPRSVVESICRIAKLDKAIEKHGYELRICEPACGDGAILSYVAEVLFSRGWRPEQVIASIRGCELDPVEAAKCSARLSGVARGHGYEVLDEQWRVSVGDAFETLSTEVGTAHVVLGNPPYIRVHNMDDPPESKWISGMCDSYYAFYDLGLSLLSDDGTLCYIAPSSWFAAKAGEPMRKDLEADGNVNAVLDFGHVQLFAAATTYTAIVAMTKTRNEHVSIYEPVLADDGGYSHEKLTATAAQSDCWIDGLFLPGVSKEIREALEFDGGDESIRVRNGFATNLDSFFIEPEEIDASDGAPLIIDIVKSSKCQVKRGIYPYDVTGKLIPFDDIRKLSPEIADYYQQHKQALLDRTNVPIDEWWCYGRSQGIADVQMDKVAVQLLTKDGRVKAMPAPAGTGVYGGVYVMGMDEEKLRKAVDDSAFFDYLRALRKYKSGGYYTCSGKEMERYLRWWTSKHRS